MQSLFLTVVLSGVILLLASHANCDNNFKVICYWPNHHNVSIIDPKLCTHIHYSFFILNETTAAPVDNRPNSTELYKQLNALKQNNTHLKIIVSIGGWGDEAEKYSRVFANDSTRHLFVENAYQLMIDYSFDGFDLDYEFPVCWQDNCTAGPVSDREDFSKVIRELREKFDSNSSLHLSVSAAVKGDEHISSLAYNFADLNKYLDYLSVMTYDDYGYLVANNRTQHHSAYQYCIDTLNFYHRQGVEKNKLLIGVPFYGRSFTLINASEHGIGAPIVPLTIEGTPARDYVEICEEVRNGTLTMGYGFENGTDPYAYRDTYWVGFDDPKQAFNKADYVRMNGFGGVIIWEIGLDDIDMVCHNISYPLLRAINDGLYREVNSSAKAYDLSYYLLSLLFTIIALIIYSL